MERRASEAKTVRQGNEGEKDQEKKEDGSIVPEADEQAIADDTEDDDAASMGDSEDDYDAEDPTEWLPGEGVEVDYAAIVAILVRHLDVPGAFLLCSRSVSIVTDLNLVCSQTKRFNQSAFTGFPLSSNSFLAL